MLHGVYHSVNYGNMSVSPVLKLQPNLAQMCKCRNMVVLMDLRMLCGMVSQCVFEIFYRFVVYSGTSDLLEIYSGHRLFGTIFILFICALHQIFQWLNLSHKNSCRECLSHCSV